MPALDSKLLDLIEELEDRMECSGLCGSNARFWFYKDISEGMPGENCQKGIDRLNWESIGVLSLGLIVTGSLIFFAFNAQYGLWRRRFNKPHKSRSHAYKIED